ncbi:MAG: hypothetical protein PUE01_07745 [Clostridiaceae bacterium]|nr:hypothetical protein [Clostridiaceae bacterium]
MVIIHLLKKRERASGSILVECSIGIFILIICIIVSLQFLKKLIYAEEKRNSSILMNESMYALSEEIKYNYSFEEVKNFIKNKAVTLKYDDRFMESVMDNSDLNSFQKTYKDDEYIKITLCENDIDIEKEDYFILNFEIKYKDMIKTRKVVKGKWMDYICVEKKEQHS